MDGCNYDRPRNVIPRWRNFTNTVELGELGTPIGGQQSKSELPPDLAHRLSNWRPTDAPVYSADLLSSALVAGRREAVVDAAKKLLTHAGPAAAFQRLAAKRVLCGYPPARGGEEHAVSTPGAPSRVRSRIVAERKLLRGAPQNPIAWTELAHAYTAIGQRTKAQRCLQTACQLAPDNRFVLRSATRFWIHDGDPEHSLWLLRRSSRTRVDPWLLAAELATSTVCGRNSREAKRAEKLLRSQGELSIHFSELAAAIGVLECENGHMRRARNLFLKALQRPTENALTQALWFNRSAGNKRLETMITERLAVPRGYEALAWIRYTEGSMDQAVDALEAWLEDEPFASRPAIDASYLATLALEDHGRAQEIAKIGLLANPTDYRLENNLAVAQLHMNHLKEAVKTVARLPRTSDNPRSQATMRATRGLLAFRLGDLELGARLYLTAADEAATNNLKDVETQALWTGALEAIKAGLPKEHPLISRASTHGSSGPAGSPTLNLLRARVKHSLERIDLDDEQSPN